MRSRCVVSTPCRLGFQLRLSLACSCLDVQRRKLPAGSSIALCHSMSPSSQSESIVSNAEQHVFSNDIVASFKLTPFEPFPLANPHFQTIFAYAYPVPPRPEYSRLTFRSDDGLATFSVDIANGTSLSPDGPPEQGIIEPAPEESLSAIVSRDHPSLKKSNPVAVVLTGLESTSTSPVTCRMVHALKESGLKVLVLNYRSCAGPDDLPTTFRLYHAGFTEDVEALLRAIRHSAVLAGYSPPNVFLCGVSLGANVMCNFLGRHRAAAREKYGVIGAAGACVPFDPASCQREIDNGWKGPVYSAFLIRRMRSKFDAIYATGVDSGVYDLAKVRAATRLGHIDDHYISPTFGFANRLAYYATVDSKQFLRHIAVPTLIINALDDPFYSHASGIGLPSDNDIANAPVLLHISEHGGHCAFLDRETFKDTTSGYLQREFARWFHHIQNENSNSTT